MTYQVLELSLLNVLEVDLRRLGGERHRRVDDDRGLDLAGRALRVGRVDGCPVDWTKGAGVAEVRNLHFAFFAAGHGRAMHTVGRGLESQERESEEDGTGREHCEDG